MSENRVKTTQKHAWTASRVKNKAIDIVIYVFITLVSLTCLLPFIHVVSKSISEERFVVTKQVFLIPKGLTFDAYLKVFADASIMQSLYVTVIMTVLFTVLGMFLTICAAYPLSRKNLKGRKVINFIFIFTMYFAGGMIPDYLLMNSLGMLEKMTSLVLPLAFSAYTVSYTHLDVYKRQGLGVVLGHNYPFYLKFKGGKGIAATGGFVIALGDWKLLVFALSVFLLTVAATRFVSLGSLLGVSALFIGWVVFTQLGWIAVASTYLAETYVLMFLFAALAFFQHRKNIVRLMKGTENKLGAKKS